MPRPRTVTRTREAAAAPRIPDAFRYAMESLERRQLFDTIGLDAESGVFEYKDALNNTIRVAYNNVLAELVFARVNKDTNEVTLSTATPRGSQEDGKDLFHIYVAQAGPGSFISVAQVPSDTAPRPMQPFSGSVSLTVVGRGGFVPVTTAGGSGVAYLGARTKDTPAEIANEINRPILTDQFSGMGILGPRKNGRLTAGLHVEGGQDFGRFFWGGAVSGQVQFGGSIDTFYAGALLTGDTRGNGPGDPLIPNNFLVNGDIRDLIVMGSIGTHADANGGLPVYNSGFDMQVNGTIGRVQTYNHLIGNIRAQNDPAFPRLRMSQREIETKVLPRNRGSATHFEGSDNIDVFDSSEGQPRLGDNQDEFNNDTFDTAQFVGTINSRTLGAGAVTVSGRLQYVPTILDEVDYYGLALMAGQTIQVQLLAPYAQFFDELETEELAAATLTIFDPDGRLVASDANNVDDEATINRLFQFTADRPGVYRFAVNVGGEIVNLLDYFDYQLKIRNAGVMSIGAIHSTGQIFGETFAEHQVVSTNGDLGVIFAGADFGYAGASGVFVDGGNLRAVDAASIGYEEGGNRFSPGIETFGGNLGVVRARTAFANIFDIILRDNRRGVGGSAQLIEAPNGSLRMRVAADQRLGVVRAQNMATAIPSIIRVNADDRGADGIIDLIDVDGDFGTLGSGGPQITTGTGGNVRYIHVDGITFRDIFFGGGAPDIVQYAPGESVPFVDDSGTQMLLTPAPNRRFDPQTGFPLDAGTLSVTRYGIRESGGSVLVNLTSSQGVEVAANGQQAGRGSAEIGEINANGLGTLIEEDEGERTNTSEDDELTLATDGENLEVNITGGAVVDVYEIVGGNFTRIDNQTAGEIVNVTADSIGEIVGATLGLAKSHTGTVVGGNTILGAAPTQVGPIPDAGPFNQQRIGIVVGDPAAGGDIISARARQGLGNFIVSGSIQELIANSDGRNTKGVHEGINGPIMTRAGGVATEGGGEIRFVQIGEGILPSGTGSVSFSGIFAHSRIGQIVNQGEGSDIRGDVHSQGENRPTFRRQLSDFTFEIVPLEAIGTISLGDGAIINSDIQVTQRFQNAWEIGGGPIVTPSEGTFSGIQVNDIGAIGLDGKGGIMSSLISAANVGNIEVKGGFGIFHTSVESTAEGDIGNVVADGYGIRNTFFEGGGDIASIVARGSGKRLNALAFTSSVRYSEKTLFDPFSGFQLSDLNDLHRYLGTSAAAPIRTRGDYGRSGVIDQVDARGSGGLGSMSAYQIKSSAFNYADAIDTVVVRDYIDTMLITTGRLNSLQTRRDVHNADWRIAGPVGTVQIGRTWRGTSILNAAGPNGQIGTFTANAMYGTLTSTNDINEVIVANDMGSVGSFNVEDGERQSAGIDVGRNLNLFRVGGSILDGATVFVDDRLGTLVIGGDLQEGASIDTQTLGTLDNDGDISGDLRIRSQE